RRDVAQQCAIFPKRNKQNCASTFQFCCRLRYSALNGPDVGDVEQPFAAQEPLIGSASGVRLRLAYQVHKPFRQTSCRNSPEVLAIIDRQRPLRRTTENVRLLQNRIEYGREIAGRRIDQSQDFGGRSLLLQSLARLGDQARVLHRDDGLRREVLDQCNLLIGEGPNLLAVNDKSSK